MKVGHAIVRVGGRRSWTNSPNASSRSRWPHQTDDYRPAIYLTSAT
jgi:hypothetical protein